MTSLFFAILILSLGLLIGWSVGTAYHHWPMINYFRNYYHRHAEARIAQHAQFVNGLLQAYAANPSCLIRRSARAARLGGRGAATPDAASRVVSGSRFTVLLNGEPISVCSINSVTRGGSEPTKFS